MSLEFSSRGGWPEHTLQKFMDFCQLTSEQLLKFIACKIRTQNLEGLGFCSPLEPISITWNMDLQES